ncbi:MAG: hypothetical protein IPP49_17490 [Saprospiraceae bacterium]|nr:hypothetical protein [Saprospiraceae bacterium]
METDLSKVMNYMHKHSGVVKQVLPFLIFINFVSGALASRYTVSIPATQLILNEKDKVLIVHLHDYLIGWSHLIKILGPEIFDLPTKDGNIPFY